MTDEDPFFGGGDRTIMRPRPGGRRPAQQPAPPPAPTYAPPPAYPPPQQPGYAPPPQQGYAPPPQPGYAPPQQPAYSPPQQPAYAPPPSYNPPPPSYEAQRSYQPPPVQPAQAAPQAGAPQLAGGLNPITSAATTLLALTAQLRDSAHHPDPQALFQHVSNELRQFEAAARAAGEPPDSVLAARYILCTTLDETVLNTPWGSQSVWATQTLLATFHNEAWGGEKVFQLLERMLQEPGRNLHVLELIYLCIALGFEGKFRVQERGRGELERLHDSLYQTIRLQRGDFERSLSPHWKGVEQKRSRLVQYVPLWVVAAVCAGVLVFVYFGFLLAANRAAEGVLTDIAALGRSTPGVARTTTAPRPNVELRPFLQTEIAQGTVEIRDVPQGQMVTMAGDGLFASGRADVRPERMRVLLAIADALNQVPGRVLITGHTDNVRMSVTGRYKSNWDLSQARADAVLQILSTRVPADRLVADGVADTEPLVANDSAENRSRNRRVEITLSGQAGRQ